MSSDRRLERPGSETVFSVNGSGPAVVLGHSLFCDRSMWRDVVPSLSDYTLINIGLRGHGESSATAPFTLWNVADDWLAILDELEIKRAALVGLSTGGMTAMRVATLAPERVTGLALIDSDADAEASAWKRLQYSALGLLYRRTGIVPTRTLAKAMFCPETLSTRRELVTELVTKMRAADRAQLAHAMKAVFGRDTVDVSGIKAPTLVVVGAHDVATPPERSARIAATIEGAVLETIDGAGHLSALETPEIVSKLLSEFLPRCTASSR